MSDAHEPQTARSGKAPMLEDVALAVATVRRSRFEAGDRVAVLGLNGPGIAAVRFAHHLGAGRIDCVDDGRASLDTASAPGASPRTALAYAQWVRDNPTELPRRLLVFAPSPGLFELAVNAADRRGVIVVVARAAPERATIPDYYLNMIMKETAIIGIDAPLAAEQQEAEALLRSGWER